MLGMKHLYKLEAQDAVFSALNGFPEEGDAPCHTKLRDPLPLLLVNRQSEQ